MAGFWVCFQQDSVFASGIVWNLHFVQGLCYIIYMYIHLLKNRSIKQHHFVLENTISFTWFRGVIGWSTAVLAAGSWCFQMRPRTRFCGSRVLPSKRWPQRIRLGDQHVGDWSETFPIHVGKSESLRMNFVEMRDDRDAQLAGPPSWLYLPSRWISEPVAFLNQMPMDMWPCLCQSTSWAIPVHWTHKMHNKKKCRAGSGHRVIKIKVSNFFLFYVLKIATKLPALSGKCEQPSHGKFLLDWFLKAFLSNYLQSPG